MSSEVGTDCSLSETIVLREKSLGTHTQCLFLDKRTCSWIGLEDMCFPPEQRQPSLLPVIRDLGSISSDFHSCNATHWVYRCHWGSLESPWRNQSYRKQYKPRCYADYCDWYWVHCCFYPGVLYVSWIGIYDPWNCANLTRSFESRIKYQTLHGSQQFPVPIRTS